MNAPILILDDDPVQILALEDILQGAGYPSVVSFTRAAAAQAFVAQQTPALAFLDIRLAAGETSEELALQLMAKTVPFVFMTGLQGLSRLDPALSGSDFIEKPFNGKAIHARLEAYGLTATR